MISRLPRYVSLSNSPDLQALVLAAILALLSFPEHRDHQLGAQRLLTMFPDDLDAAVEEPHRILHLRGGVLQLAGIHSPLGRVRVQRAELLG